MLPANMTFVEQVFSTFRDEQFKPNWVKFENGTVFHTGDHVEDRDILVQMANDCLSKCHVIPGTPTGDVNVTEVNEKHRSPSKDRFFVTYYWGNVMTLPEYDVSLNMSPLQVGLKCRDSLCKDVDSPKIECTSMD